MKKDMFKSCGLLAVIFGIYSGSVSGMQDNTPVAERSETSGARQILVDEVTMQEYQAMIKKHDTQIANLAKAVSEQSERRQYLAGVVECIAANFDDFGHTMIEEIASLQLENSELKVQLQGMQALMARLEGRLTALEASDN